jgi:RNA polymerase sigma-70 factor (ECF subfamily)
VKNPQGSAQSIPADGLYRADSASSGARSRSSEKEPGAALIEQAQRGDPHAFSALMDLYRERLIRLGLHMIGSVEDAQDLCQETFVRVYRALGSFDRRRAFTPWIYRIAHNVILDFLRRKKARPAFADSEEERRYEEGHDLSAEDPQQKLISEEIRKEVRAAIWSLPDNYRSVVVFRYLDDLSYTEIAEALELTEANVMMRMSRARRMLKDKLKDLRVEGMD